MGALSKDFLQSISGQKVLVLGDIMLDEYLWCDVTRISPEAPVPICKVLKRTQRPGGAANVVYNIAALSGKAYLSGYLGDDESGSSLLSILSRKDVSLESIIHSKDRLTTVKSRIVAQKQQMLRLDDECVGSVPSAMESKLLEKVDEQLAFVSVLVLSDYGKGVLSDAVISTAIQRAKSHGVPVLVDPKGDNYLKYKGATLLTPNFSEFQEAVKERVESEDEIKEKGLELMRSLDLDSLIITRSEKGMSLLQKDGKKLDIPTQAREVSDISGAGDTVVAALSLALASGTSLETAMNFANVAAGIVVGKVGTAVTNLDELKKAL